MTSFKFTIRKKIILMATLLQIIILLIGYFGINGTQTAHTQTELFTNKVNPALLKLYSIDRDGFQAQMALRGELIPGDANWKKRVKVDFEENAEPIITGFQDYKKAFGFVKSASEEEALQKGFEEAYAKWYAHAKQIHELAVKGTPESMAQAQAMLPENSDLWWEMRGQLDGLQELLEPYSEQVLKDIDTQNIANVKKQAITLGFGCLIGLILAIFIIRSIRKPIELVTQRLHDLAQGEGDLTKRLNLQRNDEIGTISNHVDSFMDKLNVTFRGILETVIELAATGEQLSQNSNEATRATQQVATTIEQVAKGSSEQSRSITDSVKLVDQVAQAIDQITSGAQEQSRNVLDTTNQVGDMVNKINKMADGMETVKQVAEQNGEVAINGGKSVEKTVNGMLKVKEAVFETAQRIHELGDQSQKIGDIIQVIDDIAEQTNLLALNAAIEAARAGEHGKGFAVVADEVRKLAERSSKATKEIAELITDIQRGTKVAVESMQIGTREVEEGVNLAQEAGQSLNEIVQGVRTTGDNVHHIMDLIQDILSSSQAVSSSINNAAAITEENTAATEEMSASADQVNLSIQNVATISQENAAAAEEVSASTEELTASIEEITASAEQLAKMSEKLRTLVKQFKV